MIIESANWASELIGKHLYGIRPHHSADSPVPEVVMTFTDRTCYVLSVLEGVFFESCLINTLRKAQPIVDVDFDLLDMCHTVSVWADTFPLFEVNAVNRSRETSEFPFVLTKMENGDG